MGIERQQGHTYVHVSYFNLRISFCLSVYYSSSIPEIGESNRCSCAEDEPKFSLYMEFFTIVSVRLYLRNTIVGVPHGPLSR